MTSLFRTTALAAVLAATSFGVLAGPIEINFNSLGVVDGPTGVPKAGPFTDQNVTVTGAFAYAPGMLDELENDPKPNNTTSGFIANRGRGSNPGVITIELGDVYTNAGRYFQSVSMKMWSPGQITIQWLNAAGSVLGTKNPTFGGAANDWNTILTPSSTDTGLPWDQLAVERLSISAGNGVLAVDDLSIQLTAGSTIPNPAPEPASFALVGLALVAAGAASRRRT
jgi:PEP-CTERM motif